MALKISKFDLKRGSVIVFPLSVREDNNEIARDYGVIALTQEDGDLKTNGSFHLPFSSCCNFAERLSDEKDGEEYFKKISSHTALIKKTVVGITCDELMLWYGDNSIDPDDITSNEDVYRDIYNDSDMIEWLLTFIKETETAEKTKTEKDTKNMNISSIIERTKKATVTAAEIQAGKAITVAVVKAVKPRLPMLARGYADHPLFPVLIGIGMVAASEYLPNQAVSVKVKKAADLMLVAAMLDGADKLLDVEGWIDAAFSTLPAGVLDALKTE